MEMAANDNARIDALEAKFEARAAARDRSDNETRETLIEVAGTASQALAAVGKLGDQLTVLQNRPTPGWPQLWGPTLATAVALATGFSWILTATVAPIIERQNLHQKANDKLFEDIAKTMSVQNQRVWEMNSQQQYDRGRLDAIQKDHDKEL